MAEEAHFEQTAARLEAEEVEAASAHGGASVHPRSMVVPQSMVVQAKWVVEAKAEVEAKWVALAWL